MPSDEQQRFVMQLADELNSRHLDLPSFPDVAVRVQRALESEHCTPDTLARVVHSEPVLAARLLKLANSALLERGAGPVTELRTAISRLGFDMVRSAAVAVAMEQLLLGREYRDIRAELERLWRHSVAVSALAHVLARDFPALNRDEALLGGLMHDIGRLYIRARARDFPGLAADADELEALAAAWHTGVGRAILEKWGFSEAVCAAAEGHHDDCSGASGPATLTDLVWVANWLAQRLERRGDPPEAPGPVAACARHDLDPRGCEALVKASREEIRSLRQALGAS